DELRRFGLFRNERPLHSRCETCAAATTQSRSFYFVDDVVGLHLQRFPCGLVAVELDVAIDVLRALSKALGDDAHLIGMRDQRRWCVECLHCFVLLLYCSRIASIFCGVTFRWKS